MSAAGSTCGWSRASTSSTNMKAIAWSSPSGDKVIDAKREPLHKIRYAPYVDVRSTAKITSKGQITLPLAVRQRLGVSPGTSSLLS